MPRFAYRARLQLSIDSHEGELEVVAVAVLDANVADADLEECVGRQYLGRFPVRGAEAGRRYKVAYPITWYKR